MLAIFAPPAVVVSFGVQTKEVVEVQAVMLPTAAVPETSVTVPHTMRGDACPVLEQIAVVPQVLTFCGTAVTAMPESAWVPTASLYLTKSPLVEVGGSVEAGVCHALSAPQYCVDVPPKAHVTT